MQVKELRLLAQVSDAANTLKEVKEDSQKEKTDLASQICALECERNAIRDKIALVQGELEQSKCDLGAAEKQLSDIREALCGCKIAVQEKVQENAALSVQVEEGQEECQRLSGELSKATSECVKAGPEGDMLKEKLLGLEERMFEAKTELAVVKSQLEGKVCSPWTVLA